MNLRRIRLFVSTCWYLWFLISCGGPPGVVAGQKGQIFSTWEDFEADKCASIWLIKRFIDKNATIKIFPKGEVTDEGIPFDTPDAKLRRYHNMSTFESLLRHYKLKDPRLTYIGKIIHDIEVNTWKQKRFDETPAVQDAVNQIIWNSSNSDEVIDRTCEFFDSLYKNAMTQRKVQEM